MLILTASTPLCARKPSVIIDIITKLNYLLFMISNLQVSARKNFRCRVSLIIDASRANKSRDTTLSLLEIV